MFTFFHRPTGGKGENKKGEKTEGKRYNERGREKRGSERALDLLGQ